MRQTRTSLFFPHQSPARSPFQGPFHHVARQDQHLQAKPSRFSPNITSQTWPFLSFCTAKSLVKFSASQLQQHHLFCHSQIQSSPLRSHSECCCRDPPLTICTYMPSKVPPTALTRTQATSFSFTPTLPTTCCLWAKRPPLRAQPVLQFSRATLSSRHPDAFRISLSELS